MILDSQLLENYMDTFYGYGDYEAAYWLIGMEEGGGSSFEEVSRRLAKWESQGRGELLDLRPHHTGGDLSHFVGSSGKLQPTWSQLIRIVLAAEGRPTDNERVRDYQQSQLGRFGGDTCLLELMPLPSPDAKKWLYKEHSSLPQLHSRDTYTKHYAPLRAIHLQSRIREHKPAAVVFYSLSYVGWWKQIAGVELTPILIDGVKSLSGHNKRTYFVVVPQPAAQIKGKGNSYYVQVGRAIASSLQSLRSGDRE